MKYLFTTSYYYVNKPPGGYRVLGESMFRSLILAVALLAFVPLANAGEITLLPSIKLQIGDQDYRGNYWDGGGWRDRDYWHHHYQWRDNHWRRHDNGLHRGWYKDRGRGSFESGYRAGWNDRDDHRGRGGRGHGRGGHGGGHGGGHRH